MKLSTYIRRQLNVFNTNLQLALYNQDREVIHDLRVALKRVFALQNILKMCVRDYEESYRIYFLEIRTIFKFIGEIRDHQLMVEWAERWLSESDFLDFEKERQSKIKIVAREINRYVERVNLNKSNLNLIKVFVTLDVIRPAYVKGVTEKYIGRNEGRILLELSTVNCNYHLIRKWVKEQYYLLQFLQDVLKVNVCDGVLKGKRELGKDIGEWHDLMVFCRCLNGCSVVVNNSVLAKLNKTAEEMLEGFSFKRWY